MTEWRRAANLYSRWFEPVDYIPVIEALPIKEYMTAQQLQDRVDTLEFLQQLLKNARVATDEKERGMLARAAMCVARTLSER